MACRPLAQIVRQPGLLALLVLPPLSLVVRNWAPNLDPSFISPMFHLLVVSGIAGAALVVALAAARSTRRTAAGPGPVLLAAGCLAVGIAMVGHGLLTPGVLGQKFSPWIGRLPWLAIFLFALALSLASVPGGRTHQRIANQPTVVLLSTFVALGVPVTMLVLDPAFVAPTSPAWESTLYWVITVAVWAMLVPVTYTHWQRWKLGADLIQFSLAGAAAMAIAAATSLRLGELWHLSWWDYHGYLLAGFTGAVYALTVSSRRSKAVADSIAEAFESDPIVHISNGYPEALRTLVLAVEAKDPYTHGHSRRTAEVAARIGSRLRLSSAELRALTRGAYLHDVGKIGIDEAILNKRGALDPIERLEIERHPEIGAAMVQGASSLSETLDVIRHHHERWDGGGYPSGLSSDAIPYLARITAVADVWDALTSDRSYRRGWNPTDALAHILAGAGTHFDPSIVEVLAETVYADLGVSRPTARGDVAVAAEAAESCHELV
jgi:putative nucleotidyltransferase with HDIG domain